MGLSDWQTVASSNIAAVSYDDETNMLGVQFLDGSIWTYANVPSWHFDNLLSAVSVGRYFRAWIMGKFDGEKS
jgi:hypothetical protein